MADNQGKPSVWQGAVNGLRVVEDGQSTELATSSSTDSQRADVAARKAFATELAPCLALSSGIGMSADDRREWLSAAYRAIGHYPGYILAEGAKVAMREADHPSKIVPIITRVAEPMLAQRRSVDRMLEGAKQAEALPAPGGERCTKDELDAICRQHGVGRHAKTEELPGRPQALSLDPARPCKTPSRADYIRLGVSAEALDGMGITA